MVSWLGIGSRVRPVLPAALGGEGLNLATEFSFNMFDHPIPRVFQNRFSTQYRCFSVSMLAGPNDRSDVEKGGKIIMPPSALDQLSRLNITYPMLFKLTNKNSDRMTHCGVLEFVADEGICYLPHWMMQNLLLEEGGLVQVESVNLQVATYSKFQPQSPDFLDITNPKAVLENALRNFACLTTGDVIAINYNEKIYELRVMETKPDKAVSIIECDMNVDFDAPLGYKEPERPVQHEESIEGEADHSGYGGEVGFRAFSGSGNRLDGKKKGVEPSPSPIKPGDIKRGIPNYEFKLGKITFIRNSRPLVKKIEEPPRPCEVYRAEWELCRSAGHVLHHYYVHGERPDCRQWLRDLTS
ncbi:Ubiquitin fusion degradation protein 1-like protein [Microtus ochrogaster]|uniref:Ubiquitin recognition factor in ER-associated degradation protein 1 n=1 Tax=Microtus ochrogaster TaxID=79684 RepID=A0A8J6G052_MICOH|nr:Ubiquitin fusion degradation protein 1-like protein [Microtus ochrogaster]